VTVITAALARQVQRDVADAQTGLEAAIAARRATAGHAATAPATNDMAVAPAGKAA
jgi:hypothetical protein